MNKPKSLLHLLIWAVLIAIFFAFGCGPKTYALLPEAIPLHQDGDRVLAIFQDKRDNPNYFHAQWFYFPGMQLVNPHDYQIRVILERRKR